MPFNINDFIQNTSNGFAREAHFEAQITLPVVLNNDTTQARKLSLACNAAQIPGRRIDTITASRYGLGLFQPFAVGTQYDPLNLEFYCDSSAENLKLLHKWMDEIFPPNLHVNNNSLHVEFPDKYKTTINLIQYNSQGESIAEWVFHEAFPESLPPISLSWSARNSFIIIPSIFAYTYYTQLPEVITTTPLSQTFKRAKNNQLPQIQGTQTPILSPFTPGGGNFGGAGTSGSY